MILAAWTVPPQMLTRDGLPEVVYNGDRFCGIFGNNRHVFGDRSTCRVKETREVATGVGETCGTR